MKKLILLAAAVSALTACATTSQVAYKASPGPNSVGYLNSERDADDRFTVVYTGAKGVSQQQVAKMALLRAAELTQQQGEEWFAVIATSSDRVELIQRDEGDLASKGALTSGSASSTTGAAPSDSAGSDVDTNLGPSTGGFGGGDVPYQVIERWTPPKGYQSTIIIQVGSGDEASFPGATSQPQIFPAQSTAAQIRTELGL